MCLRANGLLVVRFGKVAGKVVRIGEGSGWDPILREVRKMGTRLSSEDW
jgi:hypothetical protein